MFFSWLNALTCRAMRGEAPSSIQIPSPRSAVSTPRQKVAQSPRAPPATPRTGYSTKTAKKASPLTKKSASTSSLASLRSSAAASQHGTPRSSKESNIPSTKTHASPSRRASASTESVHQSTSPLRFSSPQRHGSPDKNAVKAENQQLQSALLEVQESHDREMAMRLREEAERTLGKVEELWRVSNENEALKKENEALKADKARADVEASILGSSFRQEEDEMHGLLLEVAQAQLAIVQLERSLASFNRHSIGLCGCNEAGPSIPNRHRVAKPTASYRSASPRFGSGAERSMRGEKMGSNVALNEEAARRRQESRLTQAAVSLGILPRTVPTVHVMGASSSSAGERDWRREAGDAAAAKPALGSSHDLAGLSPPDDCLAGTCSCNHRELNALTRVLAAGIKLGRSANRSPEPARPLTSRA